MRNKPPLLALLALLSPPALAATDAASDTMPDTVPDAWRNSFTLHAEVWTSACSHDSLRPLLSYTNEWGQYTLYKQLELGALAQFHYQHRFHSPRLSFRTGAAVVLNTEGDRWAVAEFFANFRLAMFTVKLGWDRYSPVPSNDEPLSVGSYLMNRNAEPMPRFWVGILDYWSIPMPRTWPQGILQIRGGFSLGRLDNDDDPERFTDDILYHEKFAAVRIGAWHVKPYGSLYHSVMMGGRLPDGTSVPVDFLHSLFGKGGGDDFLSHGWLGETTNAAGGHQGMWDFGLDVTTPAVSGRFFYQQPFADSKAQRPFVRRGALGGPKCVADFTLGAHATINHFRPLHSVCVEYTTTRWQGGPGFPDPYYDNSKGSHFLYPGYGDNGVEWLREHVFEAADVAAWESEHGPLTVDDLARFTSATCNRGEEFGGRTLYLENWCYPQGWTHRGLSLGHPLMMTDDQVLRYARLEELQDTTAMGARHSSMRFPLTRVRGLNVGLAGDALDGRLQYSLRVTGTRNYGNLRQLYYGSSSWRELQGYFFASPRTEVYSRLDVSWTLRNQIKLSATLSLDRGDLYDAFSARVQASYTLQRKH